MTRSSASKSKLDIDASYRSLLQKAVRRGNVDLVFTLSARLESLGQKERNWFASRTAIITFEECWPLGAALVFNKKFHSKVAALIKVAKSFKARDATGLGYLACALFEGDRSVLDDAADDRPIKILAQALERPEDFWQWTDAQSTTGDQRSLIKNAGRFRNSGSAQDRSVLQAAAYLAVTEALPEIQPLAPADQTFPYWIAFDRHTREGRRALRDVARDLHIPLPQLEWACFYFEGSKTNADICSKWWERHCRWHFRKIGLPAEEAHLLWEPAKPQVMEALAEERRNLRNELYKWKIANAELIESLKKQVEIFNAHIDEVPRDQLDLF